MTSIHVHEDWATPGFDLPAAADGVGPFVRREILDVWYRHRGGHGKVMLVEGLDALLPLFADDRSLHFLGEEDLTDYHSPLGDPADVAQLAAHFFSDVSPGTDIRLDSLPAGAADALETGMTDAGIVVSRETHEIAAVLDLPTSFDDWLAGIGKKERHEVRRKRRRFEAELGSPHLSRVDGPEAVALFCRLHRASDGEKGTFMTGAMEALFMDLHVEAGAVVDVLSSHDGSPVAAAFGFEHDDAYYLYNSAYDPAARNSSPGIVMLASLIERAIDADRTTFDFLKGDEPYKFRHGAVARPLDVLTGKVAS